MDTRDITLVEADFETILSKGKRVERINRICNQNDFLQDLKPFIEDIKLEIKSTT